MRDIIHQKKEHMIMKLLYDFFHKLIKTKQRIIALNNDGFVLLLFRISIEEYGF